LQGLCWSSFPSSQQVECSIDGGAVKIAAGVRGWQATAGYQAHEDSLGNILRIGHAPGDAIGCDENAPMMLAK
jgi:hypothetical protein